MSVHLRRNLRSRSPESVFTFAEIATRRKAGLAIPAEFLAHVSPLGWEHINLTGEYRWPRTGSTGSAKPLGQ